MNYIPNLFNGAQIESYDKTSCSPAIPTPFDWVGIIIAAPQKIILEKGEKPIIPICGYYLVPVLAAMKGSPLSVHINPIISKNIFSGLVINEGDNEPEIPPPDDPSSFSENDFKDVSTGGYFNINAQRYINNLLPPGNYDIIITFADLTSNTVRVEII